MRNCLFMLYVWIRKLILFQKLNSDPLPFWIHDINRIFNYVTAAVNRIEIQFLLFPLTRKIAYEVWQRTLHRTSKNYCLPVYVLLNFPLFWRSLEMFGQLNWQTPSPNTERHHPIVFNKLSHSVPVVPKCTHL